MDDSDMPLRFEFDGAPVSLVAAAEVEPEPLLLFLLTTTATTIMMMRITVIIPRMIPFPS
jgi:hypothetical protein